MNLDSRVNCRSNRETLWAAIFNPEAWKASIPDAHDYEQVGDNEYEMTVKVDFGPLKGNQTVKIIFSDLDEPNSCSLAIENKMIKSMTGSYRLVEPGTETGEDAAEIEAVPEGTQTIFLYQIATDLGNPMFNAIVDSFKARVESGFNEIIGRLDNYASGATETTD